MQQHQIGYDLMKGIEFLTDAAEIILTRHERCDGSGYPQGLKAADIPIGAKILAVADTVDAMTSDRPYRPALPFQAAREQIKCGAGEQYDSRVAEVFLQISNERWETIRTETGTILWPGCNHASGATQGLGGLTKPGVPRDLGESVSTIYSIPNHFERLKH